ncbi:class I SAM-dependent DNA methyltransferase [Desulfonatronum sp. SC1]|uniref:HsdM family class I SAM-dependent methyltransferase n=1 Tax=Desulfonatronum sp. SC1 TaxID=2109626 RepID=UPI000D313B40|nr:N-6 DNA methylase [Desulfonatronum sp. SC1]PTN31771.1 hypothetical protein C6366_17630 [Desulfonatronum sp. SC1]
MSNDFDVLYRIEKLAQRDLGWDKGVLTPFLALWRIMSQDLGEGQGEYGFDAYPRRGNLAQVLGNFEQNHAHRLRNVFSDFLALHRRTRDIRLNESWGTIHAELRDNTRKDVFRGYRAAGDYAETLSRILPITPYPLCEMIAEMLEPGPRARVLDLGCGSGMGLLAFLERRPELQDPVGWEISPELANLAACNLLLFGHAQADIKVTDVLATPLTEALPNTAKFDHVICHPPTGYKTFRKADVRKYLRGTFAETLIERGYQELLFAACAVHHMHPTTGKAALFLPAGFLVSQAGLNLRRHVVDSNILDAVMLLPSSMTPMLASRQALVILNRQRTHEAVLLFDPGEEDVPAKQMIQDYRRLASGHVSSQSRLVGLEDVKSRNYNLNPLAYADQGQSAHDKKNNLDELERAYLTRKEAAERAEKALQEALEKLAPSGL